MLENGDLYACGRNANGELGIGNKTQTSSWTKVLADVIDIYATAYNAFAIKSDGLYGAGLNQMSMLGTGSTSARTSWTIANGNLSNVSEIKTEIYYDGSSWFGGTVIRNGDKLLACGSNNNNQILDSSTSDQPSFVEISSLNDGADFAITRFNIAILQPSSGDTDFLIRGGNTYGYGDTNTALNVSLHKTKTFSGYGWKIEVPERYDTNEECIYVYNEERQEIWAFGKNSSNNLGIGSSSDTKEFAQVLLPHKAKKQFEVGLQWGGTGIGSLVVVADGEIYACGNTNSNRVNFQCNTMQKQS